MNIAQQQVGRTAARFLKAVAISQGNMLSAKSYVEGSRWVDELPIKAAVDAMMTGTTNGLSDDVNNDFVALVYPKTIIGRLTHLRRVPFITRAIRQTSGVTSYWVPEGEPKPVSLAQFAAADEIRQRKVVAFAVVTQEVIRTTKGEAIIANDLGASAVLEMDRSFIDPENAGVEDERPSSITHGVTPIAASDDPAADFDEAVKRLVANGGDLTTAAWIMHPTIAVTLNLKGGAFEALGALGGELAGLPVITSSAVPLTAGTSPIMLVDASGIELAGSDTATLRTSTEAAILMESDPESGASELVSLWQTNSVALLAEIPVNWRTARPGSVVVISGAEY